MSGENGKMSYISVFLRHPLGELGKKNRQSRGVFVEEVNILENKPFAQNRDFRRKF